MEDTVFATHTPCCLNPFRPRGHNQILHPTSANLHWFLRSSLVSWLVQTLKTARRDEGRLDFLKRVLLRSSRCPMSYMPQPSSPSST
jgi:hypothetical protein